MKYIYYVVYEFKTGRGDAGRGWVDMTLLGPAQSREDIETMVLALPKIPEIAEGTSPIVTFYELLRVEELDD